VVGGRPRRGPCVSATSIGDAAAARPEVNRSRKSYRSDIGPAATVNRESKQDKLEVAPRFAADPGMPGRVLVRSRSGVWFPEGAWVSNAFLGRAEAGYLRLPPKLRQALESKGVRIVLVNDLRETSVAAPAGSTCPAIRICRKPPSRNGDNRGRQPPLDESLRIGDGTSAERRARRSGKAGARTRCRARARANGTQAAVHARRCDDARAPVDRQRWA
jgi:hypothetical protein